MADARLEAIARECRVQIIRMLTHAGSGHPGGSLSVIDLLVALYFGRLRHDPKRPDWPERDRVVLSKGHAVPALYTVMAEAGYFPVEELITLRKQERAMLGRYDRVSKEHGTRRPVRRLLACFYPSSHVLLSRPSGRLGRDPLPRHTRHRCDLLRALGREEGPRQGRRGRAGSGV